MVLKYHVSLEFLQLNTDKKLTFGANLASKLTTNIAEFANLPYTPVALGAANTLLGSTYQLWKNNGDSAKGNYFNAEYDWKLKFKGVAQYVDITANGNLAIIDNSGYVNTDGAATKSKVLAALTNFKAHGNSAVGAGVVKASVDSYAGLRAYLFTMAHPDAVVTVIGNQITVSMAGVVIFSFMLNSKSSANFTRLTSLTKMEAQAAGFNTAGIGALSQAVEVSVP